MHRMRVAAVATVGVLIFTLPYLGNAFAVARGLTMNNFISISSILLVGHAFTQSASHRSFTLRPKR